MERTEEKGLMVEVYRNSCRSGDTTRGGVSAKHDKLLLTGFGVPPVTEAFINVPVVKLVRRVIYGEERIQIGDGAFGGNFAYSSDGRFPSKYPIPIHDRAK